MTTINSTVSALCVAIDVFKHRHEVMKGAEREKFEKKTPQYSKTTFAEANWALDRVPSSSSYSHSNPVSSSNLK